MRGLRPRAPSRMRGLLTIAPTATHVLTLSALLGTAIVAAWFAARDRRLRKAAEERNAELARLRRLDNLLLESGDADAVLAQVAENVVRIFEASGAVFFDPLSDTLFRAGPQSGLIDEVWLKEAATGVRFHFRGQTPIAVAGVRGSGSLGVVGSNLSRRGFGAIAERVGVVVARARAAHRTMEAELQLRSGNFKSAVLDALAHEIKGPFSTVRISVSTLLSKQPGTPAQQRELLEIAGEELERIDRWIDDAIRTSSRDASELRLNKIRHPIGEVVTRVVDSFTHRLDGRVVRVDIPATLPEVSFDPPLVEKVIRQLFGNAMKYSPAGSSIGIAAEFTGAELVVHVTDAGCGIAKDDLARVFEKHYRGRAAFSRTPGTGLGLASAKCIMEAHGGEIWADSIPGRGSTFHISLPAAMEASVEQPENTECR